MSLPYNSYVQFPPTYNTQPTHIPPPLYQQIPFAQNNASYHTHQNYANVALPNISFTKYDKVDFPKFNGEDLRTWLYKVEQFFSEEEVTIQQKMKLVSMHFEGDALQWHLGYMKSRGHMPLPTWEEYLWALCDSFGAEYSDPMTELMNIKHTGSVKDYQRAFVSVMTRLNLSVEHAIIIFLKNFKPEISNGVRVGNPSTLPQTYYLARLQETNFVAQSQAIKSSVAEVIEEHAGTEEQKICEELEEEEAGMVTTIRNCAISLQALNRSMGYRTLRLRGYTDKRPLEVFTECGSTHNFIDEETARKLGCVIQNIKPQLVQVADGREIPTDKMCKGFKWLMQGIMFEDDFLVFPIEKSDLVLGIQWLYPLEDIKFNFRKLLIESEYKGKLLTLKGIQPTFKAVDAKSFEKMSVEGSQFFMVRVKSEGETIELITSSETEPDEVIQLLGEYSDVFGEPQQLPLSRGVFDHHIPLLEGSTPVNSRPYRYSPIKKDVIEKMVQDLVSQGIIQYSSSPYASPVVLAGKKDGSWRLCVDYRALNKLTVKEKFPIPIIEELLDELGGSQVYSKLDLRAGYHQIRMAPTDVPKTAFKTHPSHYEYLVKFGLTNAPSSFQGLMNHIFQKHLRKFILVFFDDILIYSKSLEEHLNHLRIAFDLLVQHQLLVKRSKCVFAADRMEYLGHYISAKGVETDPKKIEAVQSWPTPSSVKLLRGSLGLTGYYRRFIKGYGVISQPLTNLLKKDGFNWSEKANEAFRKLKLALTTTPILTLPDFFLPFVVETDACNVGIGAILMQKGKPIAFLSKGLSTQHQALSVYDKELLALVKVVTKWSQYLAGRTFIVKTDQKALKFLLEQKLHTRTQLKWITISMILQSSTRKGRRIRLLMPCPGMEATYRRVAALFYWKKMREDIQQLLQPNKIPESAWSSISMDFIEGLPKSKEKSVIWVVVDRLTKYAHFLGLSHPYTASSLAQVFFDQIYKLHGVPEDIISDRDPIFTSKIWQELFAMFGVTLNASTAYHPQMDGQTEVVNRCLETYLKCFCSDSQSDWFQYLAAAELWYNTAFHSAIQCSPYEALYGQPPPLHLPYMAGDSAVEEVDRSLLTREFKL
ncbi:PREDICTED: uncharacterized protein LOC109236005 [Nicotiana attenuata]|uniref:uncharacterized protein LOC109236005 n=1 Tax=Nicotiana attenuata TaxID=49451 RepID=UPI0009052C03|nr:PREDICTED: uncharacterized protein LOC109236005 [Nicotiana attenuata]